jgi:hypothetical protein
LPNLAKQHRQKLPPTRESPRMALATMPRHRVLKLHARKQLEKLVENAAYSIHGGSLLSRRSRLLAVPSTLVGFRLFRHS